jgi:Tol biopolymer transport system component
MAQHRAFARFVVGSVVPFGAALLALAAAGPSAPERVSIADGGGEPDGACYESSVTGNGRFVAYYSYATNLFPDAGNGVADIVVRDRKEGVNLLASHTPAGAEGSGTSAQPAISNNGRFVVFYSGATDLVDSDGNGNSDIFLSDMKTGDVVRVSEPPGGGDSDDDSYVYGASISQNGRYVVYYSHATNLVADDTNGHWDIFLYDRVRGTTTLVSRNPDGDPSNGDSNDPSLSPNGRFIAYYSGATDLVAGDTTGNDNIFVYDTKTGAVSRASPGMEGAEADDGSYDPVVTNNGRWVAFYSYATNLVAGDTNGFYDTFLYDRKSGTMRLLSVAPDGTEADGQSYEPAISANGKVLVFYSYSSNLVANDGNGTEGDILLVDLKTGDLTLLSADADGAGGDGYSFLFGPSLSSNGKYVVFASESTNLVAGDTNAEYDEFLVRLK